jgi:hypothetical protein
MGNKREAGPSVALDAWPLGDPEADEWMASIKLDGPGWCACTLRVAHPTGPLAKHASPASCATWRKWLRSRTLSRRTIPRPNTKPLSASAPSHYPL